MSEMIERCRIAAADALYEKTRGQLPREVVDVMVRAVIDAMRVPTEAMRKAGYSALRSEIYAESDGDGSAWIEADDHATVPRETWQSMIDAALKGS